MGQPAEFGGQTLIIGKPHGWTEEQCRSLPAKIGLEPRMDNQPAIVSCWALSDEEVHEIVRTRRIWLKVLTMPMIPASVSGFEPEVIPLDSLL